MTALKLPILALIVGLVIGFGSVYFTQSSQISSLKSDLAAQTTTNSDLSAELVTLKDSKEQTTLLEAEISRLVLAAASGGGVNMKLMPDPVTKAATVELPEVFSFDQGHAFCRVDTNKDAFIMPTFAMGDVLIEPHEFYMAMATTTMDQFSVSKDSNGNNKLTITGGLDCFTEVAKTTMTLGSRDVAELATYKIEAVDAGIGGGSAGDTFEFTVYFDPEVAPVNHGVFGPEFVFTGDMISGEITIPDPR